MLITVCGKKRVGKDTFAKLLDVACSQLEMVIDENNTDEILEYIKIENAWHSLNPVAFGDSLKEITSIIYKIPLSLFKDDFKDSTVYNFITKKYYELSDENLDNTITFRQLLQNTADSLKTAFGKDIFINNLKLDKIHDFIITDCRHLNEFEFIKAKQSVKIKIIKDNGLIDNHSSENEIDLIDDNEFDFIVNNNGSLYDLYLEAVAIAQELNIGHKILSRRAYSSRTLSENQRNTIINNWNLHTFTEVGGL